MGRPLNKKASIEDTIYMVVVIFALAIGGFIITFIYNDFVDHAENVTAFNESTSVMEVFRGGQTVNDMWDYIILMVLIGFGMALVITGYFVDVHSIFFPLFILGMLAGVIVCVVVEYAWVQVVDNVIFGNLKTTNFPITDHILSNMTVYYVVMSALSMIALYAKTRSEESAI